MDPVPQQRRCPRCGVELASGAPDGGPCPRCLLAIGLDPSASANFVGSTRAAAAPPPSPEELAPFFPQYEVLELVGRGGMGAVYKARQKALDRPVAIKVLSDDTAADPEFAERFAREGRALARLNHANIVNVYESGVAGGLCYFVMEFVDGTNLRAMIRAKTAAPREALGIVRQVCDALQYAHEEGVVHRDIKPENILIDRRGRVKIADFGLAKLFGGAVPDVTLTRTQQTMGTPHYMAPEQWERPESVDHRADIYALGVVFYELLTGELPLGRFALPSQKLAIDVHVDEVVLRTLAKEPERRYQSAHEVKTHVDAIASRPAIRLPAPSRGCIGAPLYRLRYALDPRLPVRKTLFGMPLSSNWLPLMLIGFLWLSAWVGSDLCFFQVVAVFGTLAIVWKVR